MLSHTEKAAQEGAVKTEELQGAVLEGDRPTVSQETAREGPEARGRAGTLMENVASRPRVGLRNRLVVNQDGLQRACELPKLHPTRAARETTTVGHIGSHPMRTRSAPARRGRPETRWSPAAAPSRPPGAGATFPAAARQWNGLQGRSRGCPGRQRAQRASRRCAQPRAFPGTWAATRGPRSTAHSPSPRGRTPSAPGSAAGGF